MSEMDVGELHGAMLSALKKPEKRFLFFGKIPQENQKRLQEVRDYKKMLQNDLQITRKFLVEDGVVEEAFYSPEIQRLMSIRHLKEPYDELELPLFLQLQRDAVAAVKNFRLPFKRCWLEFSSDKYNQLVFNDPSLEKVLAVQQPQKNFSRNDGDMHHSLNAWPLKNPDNLEEKWLFAPRVIGQYIQDLEQCRQLRVKGQPLATGFTIQTFSGGMGDMSDVPQDAELRNQLGKMVWDYKRGRIEGARFVGGKSCVHLGSRQEAQ